MARLPYLELDDAHPDVRRALERLPPLGIFRMVANAQGAFIDWLRFGGACLDGSHFDPRLRELAILRVARLTPGADYEWVQHATIAKAVGATDEQVAALERDDIEADCLAGDDRLVVRFTTQVVHDATPDDETWAAMRERFSAAEIMHLLLVIGQYMALARVMATTRIDLDASLGGDVLSSVQRQADTRASG